MAECIHGLEEAWCSTCKAGPSKPAPLVPLGQAFTAQYGGQCPGCGDPVSPGEDIQKWSDERYRHVGCGP